MSQFEIYQLPENISPSPEDLGIMSNEAEPGHVTEKVTFQNLFSTVAKLDTNAVPAESDRFLVAPLSGSSYQMTAQELSDYLISLQPVALAVGEVYFQGNALETNFVGVGQPIIVEATYTAGQLTNFTEFDGRLTYTASDTLKFYCQADLTVSMQNATAELSFYIVLNGVVVAKSGMSPSVDGVTPSYQHIGLSCVLDLTQNDEIAIYVQNDTDTTPVIVKDFNLKVFNPGGSDSTTTTLQQAYTAQANGVIELTAAKPIEILSDTIAILPELNFKQTAIPAADDVIALQNYFSKNSAGDEKLYFNFEQAVADPNANAEASAFTLSARKNDLVGETGLYPVLTYSGLRDLPIFPRRVSGGPSGRGIASTLFNVSSPTTSYPAGVYTNIAQTIRGQNLILPNSFDVGDVIEIDCYGAIEIKVTDVAVSQTSNFRISFGNIITVTSSDVTATTLPQNYSGWFNFKFKITRGDLNAGARLNVAGSGLWLPPEGLKTITWPNTVYTTQYVMGQTYPITIEFLRGVTGFSDPGDRYDFVAWGCNVQQYSAGDNQPSF
jgi:hypothetical protein